MIKLSDYVFRFLKEQGISYAFMLPGGGAMHLVDSLGSSGIHYILFLHEQGAAIAAEAYAQHTNTPGLVVVTSGPGATNTLTAVTAGWIDSTPMLILSGQAKRSDLVGTRGVRQIGSQEVQIVPMVQGITKYAVQVLEPNEIRYHLERAYYEATNGRPGPVWLDIPLDVQGTMLEEDALIGFTPDYNEKEHTEKKIEIKQAAKQAAALLAEAKRPLLLAGNGIKLSPDGELRLRELLALVDIPVQTTWKTADMFDEDEPWYIGHPGIMGDRGANRFLQEADLLLSIGSRLDSSITAFNEPHFAYRAKKVVVDIDENELRRMDLEKDVSCACDAAEFLAALRDEVLSLGIARTSYQDWLAYGKELRTSYPTVTDTHRRDQAYVSAYDFIDQLCMLLRNDDVIVPESSGGAGEITYQAFRIRKGQKMKNAAGLGSMGFGLPYAIGACLANERRRTILLNGDGAFQLNIQEMETLKRLELPVKIFLWCNGGYASIRSMQRNNFEGRYVGSSPESGHTIPNMRRIAEAYGFPVYEIRNHTELTKNLPEVMKDDKSLVCLLWMNPEETVSPRVKAYVGPNGEMRSGLLESMWPEVEG